MADFYDPACPTEEDMQADRRASKPKQKTEEKDPSGSKEKSKGEKTGKQEKDTKPINPFIKPAPEMTAIQRRLQSLSQHSQETTEIQPQNFQEDTLVEVIDDCTVPSKKKKKKKKKGKKKDSDLDDLDDVDDDGWQNLSQKMEDFASGSFSFPPKLMELEMDQPFPDDVDDSRPFPSRRSRSRGRRGRHDGHQQMREDGSPGRRREQHERNFHGGPPRPLMEMEMFEPEPPEFFGPRGRRFRGPNGPQFDARFPGPDGPPHNGPNDHMFHGDGPPFQGPPMENPFQNTGGPMDSQHFPPSGQPMENPHFHGGGPPMDNPHFHGSGPPMDNPHFHGSGPPMENPHFHGGRPPMENPHFHGGGPPMENQHFHGNGPPMENQHFHGNGPPMENPHFHGSGPPMENPHFHGNGPPIDHQQFQTSGPPMENQHFSGSDGPPWQGPPGNNMYAQGMPPQDGQPWNFPPMPPVQGMVPNEVQPPYQGPYSQDGQTFQPPFPPQQMPEMLPQALTFNQSSTFPVPGDQQPSFSIPPPTQHLPVATETGGNVQLSSIPFPPPPKDPPPPIASSNIDIPPPSEIPMPPMPKTSHSDSSTATNSSTTQSVSEPITAAITPQEAEASSLSITSSTNVSSAPTQSTTVTDVTEVPQTGNTPGTDIPPLSPGEPEEVKNVTEHVAANGETTLVIENKPVVGTSPTSDFLEEKRQEARKSEEPKVPQDPIKTTAQKLLEKIAMKKKAAAEGSTLSGSGTASEPFKSGLKNKPLLKPVSKFLLQQGYRLKESQPVQKGGQREGKLQFNVKASGPVVQKLNPLQKAVPAEKVDLDEKNRGGAKELYKPSKEDEEELMVDKLTPKQKEMYLKFKAKEIEKQLKMKEELDKDKEGEGSVEAVSEKIENESQEKDKGKSQEKDKSKSQEKDKSNDDDLKKKRDKSEEKEDNSYRSRYSRRNDSKGYRDERRQRRPHRSRRSRSRERSSERQMTPEKSPRRSRERSLERDRHHGAIDTSPKPSKSYVSSRDNSPDRSRRSQKTSKTRSGSPPYQDAQKDISPKRPVEKEHSRDQRSASKSPLRSGSILSHKKEEPQSPLLQIVPDSINERISDVADRMKNKSRSSSDRESPVILTRLSRSGSPQNSQKRTESPLRSNKLSPSPERSRASPDSNKSLTKFSSSNESQSVFDRSSDRRHSASPRQRKVTSNSPDQYSRNIRESDSAYHRRKWSKSPERSRSLKKTRKSASSPRNSLSPVASAPVKDAQIPMESPKRSFSSYSPVGYQQKSAAVKSRKKSVSPDRSRWSSDSRDSSPHRSRWSSRSPKNKRGRHHSQTPPRYRKHSMSPEREKSKPSRRSRKSSVSPRRKQSQSQSPKVSSRKAYRSSEKQRNFSQSPERGRSSKTQRKSKKKSKDARKWSESPRSSNSSAESPPRMLKRSESPLGSYKSKDSFNKNSSNRKSKSPDRKRRRSESPATSGRRAHSPRRARLSSISPEAEYKTKYSPERSFHEDEPRKRLHKNESSEKSLYRNKSPEISVHKDESIKRSSQRAESTEIYRNESPKRSFHKDELPERFLHRDDSAERSYQRSESHERSLHRDDSSERSFPMKEKSPSRSKHSKSKKSKKKSKKHSKKFSPERSREGSLDRVSKHSFDDETVPVPFEKTHSFEQCESHGKARSIDKRQSNILSNTSEEPMEISKQSDGKRIGEKYFYEDSKYANEGSVNENITCQIEKVVKDNQVKTIREMDIFDPEPSVTVQQYTEEKSNSSVDMDICDPGTSATTQQYTEEKSHSSGDMDICDSDSNMSNKIYSTVNPTSTASEGAREASKVDVYNKESVTISVKDIDVATVNDTQVSLTSSQTPEIKDIPIPADHVTDFQHIPVPSAENVTGAYDEEIPQSNVQDSKKRRSRRSLESKEEKMKRELRKLHIDMEKNVFDFENEEPKRRSRRSRSTKSTDSEQMESQEPHSTTAEDTGEVRMSKETEETTHRKSRRTFRGEHENDNSENRDMSESIKERKEYDSVNTIKHEGSYEREESIKLEEENHNVSKKGRKRGKKGRWQKSKTDRRKVDVHDESMESVDLENISLPGEEDVSDMKSSVHKGDEKPTRELDVPAVGLPHERYSREKFSQERVSYEEIRSKESDMRKDNTESKGDKVKSTEQTSAEMQSSNVSTTEDIPSAKPGLRMPVKFQLSKVVQNLTKSPWEGDDSNDSTEGVTKDKEASLEREKDTGINLERQAQGNRDEETVIKGDDLPAQETGADVDYIEQDDDPEISFKVTTQEQNVVEINRSGKQKNTENQVGIDESNMLLDSGINLSAHQTEKSKVTKDQYFQGDVAVIHDNDNTGQSHSSMDKADVEKGRLKSICAYSDSEGEEETEKSYNTVKNQSSDLRGVAIKGSREEKSSVVSKPYTADVKEGEKQVLSSTVEDQVKEEASIYKPDKVKKEHETDLKRVKYDPFMEALQRAKDLVNRGSNSSTMSLTAEQETKRLEENKLDVRQESGSVESKEIQSPKPLSEELLDVHDTVDMELESSEEETEHDVPMIESMEESVKAAMTVPEVTDIPLPGSTTNERSAIKGLTEHSAMDTLDLSKVMLPGEKSAPKFSQENESKAESSKSEADVRDGEVKYKTEKGDNLMDVNQKDGPPLEKTEDRSDTRTAEENVHVDSEDREKMSVGNDELGNVLHREGQHITKRKISVTGVQETVNQVVTEKEAEKKSFMKLEMKRPMADVRSISSSVSSVFDLAGDADTKPLLSKLTDKIPTKQTDIFQDSDIKLPRVSKFSPLLKEKPILKEIEGSPGVKRASNLIKIGPIKLPSFKDIEAAKQASMESSGIISEADSQGQHGGEHGTDQSSTSTISRLITARNSGAESITSSSPITGFPIMPKSVPTPQWNESNIFENTTKQPVSEPVPEPVAMPLHNVGESDYDKKVDEFLKKTETPKPTFEQKVDEFLKKVEKPKPTVERKFDEFLEKVRKSNEDRKIEEFLEKVKKPTLEEKVDEFLKKTEKKETKSRDEEYKSSKYHSKDDYEHDKYRSRDHRDDRDYKDRHDYDRKSKRRRERDYDDRHYDRRDRDRSRDRSRERGRSPDRSRDRSKDRTRSRDHYRSPERSRNRSRSRSRSRDRERRHDKYRHKRSNRDREERRRRDDSSEDERSSKSHSSKHRSDRDRDGKDRDKEKRSEKLTDEWLKKSAVQPTATATPNTQPVTQGTEYYQDAYGNYFPVNPNSNNSAEYYQNYPNYQSSAVLPDSSSGYTVPGQPPLQQLPQGPMYGQEGFPPQTLQQQVPPPPSSQQLYGVQGQPPPMYGVQQGPMVQPSQTMMYGQEQPPHQAVPGSLAQMPMGVPYDQGPPPMHHQSQPVAPPPVVGLPPIPQPPIQQGQANIPPQQGPPPTPHGYPVQPGLDATAQIQGLPQAGVMGYGIEGMTQGPHGMQPGLMPSNAPAQLMPPVPPQQPPQSEAFPQSGVPEFATTGATFVPPAPQSIPVSSQEVVQKQRSDGGRAPLLPTPFPTLSVIPTTVKGKSALITDQPKDESPVESGSYAQETKSAEENTDSRAEFPATESTSQSKQISISEAENSPQSSASSTTSSTSTGRLLPIKLGIKQDFQAGKEFEPTTPPPSSSPQVKEGKPLKVKSRWRRWSELDMSSPNATGFSPTQDSNVPSSTVSESSEALQRGSEAEEVMDQEALSSKNKKDIVYDAWDPAADLVLPPPSKPTKKEPSITSLKREKREREKDKEKQSVQNADVTSQTSSDSRLEEEEKAEEDPAKPPHYEMIDENVYLGERKKSKKMKEVRRMLCDCTTSREDREMGMEACGEDCLNRMLYIECGSRCPCGEYCTNKRFQKNQYSNVEPFQTDWKGFGLKTNEELRPGDFIMEYVGEVLDYKQFKARVKQQAKLKQEHHYFMALNSDEVIDASYRGNVSRFMNHSCDPNSETQKVIDASYRGNVSRFMNHSCDPNSETQKWTVNGELRVGFFAKKEVPANTELTFDYQFERYGKEAQKCFCGSENCRGTIGGSKTTPLKTTRKVESEEKKKKTELFEDEMLEEELESMSLLENGLRNKDDVLTICRLMVRAEAPEHRKTILNLLQMTMESNCLRLFLDYHGLELLWSWMADNQDDTGEIKVMILSTLKMFPITNKNILQDSKILSLVQRWAGRDSVDELTVSSQTVTSTPGGRDMPQSILSSSTNKDKSTKKRVKFKLVDDASSSDSESRSSVTDNFGDVASNEVYSDFDASPVKFKDTQSKSEGISDLCRHVLDKSMGSEGHSAMEFSSQTAQLSPADSTNRDDENKSDIDTKIDDESSSESHVDSSVDKKQELKVDADSSSKDGDENESKNIEEEKLYESPPNKSELESLAEELLYLWKDLKEIFKIPKKQQVEERKRIEKELEKPRNKLVDRYEMIQDKSRQRAAGWDSGGRKRKRPPPPPPPSEDDSQDGRKSHLPTAPKMSKEERRQLFEAQVKAQDEMAEIQRQQQEALLQQFYSDPNNLLYLQDPNNPFHQLTQEIQMQILHAHGLEGMDQQQYIDPNTGLPVPTDQVQKQFIDPNTGLPLTPEQLQAIDPNTGQPLIAEHLKAAMQQQMQQPGVMYTEDGQPLQSQQQWMDQQQLQQPFINAQGQLVQPQPTAQGHVIPQGMVQAQDESQILPPGQQVIYTSTPQGIAVQQAANQTQGQVIQGSQQQDPQSLFLQQVLQLQQQMNIQSQLTAMTTPATTVAATAEDEEPPPPPSPPKPKVQKLPPHWKSAKDSEGKVYFYHTLTRQTQWEAPTWDQAQDDMDIDSPLFEEIIKPKSKKQTTTAAADTSSETAKKIKDQFRNKMSSYVVLCLNPFRKPDCRIGRISSTEDFKHLARKLTHHVMAKELKHCRHVEDLEVNENVKAKAKDYVKKYMSKFGSSYKKTNSPDI